MALGHHEGWGLLVLKGSHDVVGWRSWRGRLLPQTPIWATQRVCRVSVAVTMAAVNVATITAAPFEPLTLDDLLLLFEDTILVGVATTASNQPMACLGTCGQPEQMNEAIIKKGYT